MPRPSKPPLDRILARVTYENTRIKPNGYRECRTCITAARRKYRERNNP